MKSKIKWLLGTGIFLVIGLTTLLVGFALTGWNVIEWLSSPYATTFFIIIGIGAFALLWALFQYKRTKLGGYN